MTAEDDEESSLLGHSSLVGPLTMIQKSSAFSPEKLQLGRKTEKHMLLQKWTKNHGSLRSPTLRKQPATHANPKKTELRTVAHLPTTHYARLTWKTEVVSLQTFGVLKNLA